MNVETPERKHDPFEGIDKAAHELEAQLADVFENRHNELVRYTPSVKLGRRYLTIMRGDFVYSLTIEVSRRRGR